MKSIILITLVSSLLLSSCADNGTNNVYVPGRYIGVATQDTSFSKTDTLTVSADSTNPLKYRLYFSQGIAPITSSTKYITSNVGINFNLSVINTRRYWYFLSGNGYSNGDSIYTYISEKHIDSITHVYYYTTWSYAGKKQ